MLKMRLAVDRMGPDNATGYLDVVSFGNAAEGAAKVLAKGWKVGVEGQLRFSEWTSTTDGTKRSKHELVGYVEILVAPQRDHDEPAEPAPTPTAATAAAAIGEEDIPF